MTLRLPGLQAVVPLTTTLTFSFTHRSLIPFVRDYIHGNSDLWHQHDALLLSFHQREAISGALLYQDEQMLARNASVSG